MPWAIPSEPGASQASWHCNQGPGSTQRPSKAAPPRVCRTKLKGIRLCVWAMLPSNGMLVAIAQPMPAWTPPWPQMTHLLCPQAPNPMERQKRGVHDNQLLTISVLGFCNIRSGVCFSQQNPVFWLSRSLHWGHSPTAFPSLLVP